MMCERKRDLLPDLTKESEQTGDGLTFEIQMIVKIVLCSRIDFRNGDDVKIVQLSTAVLCVVSSLCSCVCMSL